MAVDWLLARRRRARGALSEVLETDVALRFVGGQWVVDDANTGIPDGYLVDLGAQAFVIDTAALGGLTLTVTTGQPYVTE